MAVDLAPQLRALARTTQLQVWREKTAWRHLAVLTLMVLLPAWLKRYELHEASWFFLLGNGGLSLCTFAAASTGANVVHQEFCGGQAFVLLARPLSAQRYLAGRCLGVLGLYATLVAYLAAAAAALAAAGYLHPGAEATAYLACTAVAQAGIVVAVTGLGMGVRPTTAVVLALAAILTAGFVPALLAMAEPSGGWKVLGEVAYYLLPLESLTPAAVHGKLPISGRTWLLHGLGCLDRLGYGVALACGACAFAARREPRGGGAG